MSHTRIAEMLLESGFEAEEMTDVVDALAPLADLADGVPAPTAELAALLGRAGGPPNRVSSLFGPRRSAVAGALVLALSGVGATGLSAAANTLPAPLQHQVSKFSVTSCPSTCLSRPPPPTSRTTPSEPCCRTALPTSRGMAVSRRRGRPSPGRVMRQRRRSRRHSPARSGATPTLGQPGRCRAQPHRIGPALVESVIESHAVELPVVVRGSRGERDHDDRQGWSARQERADRPRPERREAAGREPGQGERQGQGQGQTTTRARTTTSPGTRVQARAGTRTRTTPRTQARTPAAARKRQPRPRICPCPASRCPTPCRGSTRSSTQCRGVGN